MDGTTSQSHVSDFVFLKNSLHEEILSNKLEKNLFPRCACFLPAMDIFFNLF